MQTQTTEYRADRRRANPSIEPILVSASTARNILDIGTTKFWELVKAGKIQMTDSVGGNRRVVYASLKALAAPHAA